MFTFSFWRRWLMAASIGVTAFGTVLFLLPDVTQTFFNLLIFQQEAAVFPDAVDYLSFVYGVLGIVMIGWSVLLLAVIAIPFQRREPWAWWALALSIGIWYVIDSGFSIVSGYVPNAIMNTVFAVLFAIPLAATFRAFHSVQRHVTADAVR